MRPEHLRDMMACSRRRATNRLSRALAATEALAAMGALPSCWRWFLGSRVVFLAKKNSSKPRPVRVGEVWRRTVAKHALHQHAAKVRKRMLEAHQYGVSIPGGTDILVHTRRILEEALQKDVSSGVWAVVDVDFVNAFPSFEWGAIDEAMADQMPELAPWTRWCHAAAADIALPSGEVHHARRGAEQGDPHGSLQCGVVLAGVARAAMKEFVRRKGRPEAGCFCFWFCDDGQILCRPEDLDLFLECLDTAAALVGATRGEGSDVKSHARLIGHPEALAAFEDEGLAWQTDRVRRTCKVGLPNGACEVLGATVGPAAAVDAHFVKRTAKLRELHAQIAQVDDAACELTLGRVSAGVARCVHMLRTMGPYVSNDVLSDHDEALSQFLDKTLGGGLPHHALEQAALGVAQGGLGFRRAEPLALAAFAASRLEARPFVAHLFAAMAAAGVVVPGAMALYDAQADTVRHALLERLAPGRAYTANEAFERAQETASQQLTAILNGDRLPSGGAQPSPSSAADLLLGELGGDDPEHPAAAASRRPRLQRFLATLLDQEHAAALTGDGRAHAGQLSGSTRPPPRLGRRHGLERVALGA